jgi:hypothetical protein
MVLEFVRDRIASAKIRLILKLVALTLISIVLAIIAPARVVPIGAAFLLGFAWFLTTYSGSPIRELVAGIRLTVGQIIGIASSIVLGGAVLSLLSGYNVLLAELNDLAQAGLIDPLNMESLQDAQILMRRLQFVLPALWALTVVLWFVPRFRLRKVITFPFWIVLLFPLQIPEVPVFGEVQLEAAFILTVVAAAVWTVGWILDSRSTHMRLLASAATP